MIKKINTKKDHHTTGFKIPALFQDPRTRIVIGLFFIAFSIYLFLALSGFFFTGGMDQSLMDRPIEETFLSSEIQAKNPLGKLGAYLSNLLINQSFGVASFIFCYIFFLCGKRIMGSSSHGFWRKFLISFILIFWLSLLLGYFFLIIPTGYIFPGGAHGHFISIWLNALIGAIGTLLLLIISFICILFFGFENMYSRCARFFQKRIEQPAGDNKTKDSQIKQEEINHQPEEPENTHDGEGNEWEEEEEEEEEVTQDEPIPFPEGIPSEKEVTIEIERNTPEEEEVKHISPDDEEYDPTLDLSHYTYPVLDLLEEHSSGNPKVTSEELEANKNKIVDTLRNYNIEITRIKATIGPTVTLYEIVPAPGVKIARIKGLEDDIALSLSALGIRIIAPIPGAGTIGIEVPNQNPEIVSMRGLIASKKFQESKYALPVALGRTISNDPYIFDLAKMPHLLVAGATGQGKSVGLNAIITSLLYKKHPAQLKFVMVDPKKVELSIYSVIEKHFLAKLPDEDEAIITETNKVVTTLNSLCAEMDSRYDLLKEAQVRNIKEYNEKFVKRHLNPNKGHRYLPYIVVIVDEFADLIMTAGKEVEQPIARIAQLARAVGIHMIIATQRPSTNIITGVIKANFPARIAFKVASMIDSRTILDSPGANQLIGRGDLLISVNSEMIRVQCALVDTPEVDAITQHIANQQSYPMAYALPEYNSESDSCGVNLSESIESKDPLFEEAARLVVNTQQGSTSSIQRRFAIGYNRAGRIMDQLEAAGIVGPYVGSKVRQVLISDEYSLEQLINSLDK